MTHVVLARDESYAVSPLNDHETRIRDARRANAAPLPVLRWQLSDRRGVLRT